MASKRQRIGNVDVDDLGPADRFRVWMTAAGLRHYDAADQLGVHTTTLSLILSGRRTPTPEQVDKIRELTDGFVDFGAVRDMPATVRQPVGNARDLVRAE